MEFRAYSASSFASGSKDKLLQLLLQRAQAYDKDGWIPWGRAGLYRKKPA